jgi:class 3 adenylate cyclase
LSWWCAALFAVGRKKLWSRMAASSDSPGTWPVARVASATARGLAAIRSLKSVQRWSATAIQMIDLIRLFNEEQAGRGKVQIQIGVGIASGQVIAGYTGTQQRASYTCVGDTVNVAARLESHTKIAKRPILIEENARSGLGDGIAVESLGEVLMKGKAEPINLYAVRVDSLVAENG